MKQSDFLENLSEVIERSVDRFTSAKDDLSETQHIANATDAALSRHAENVGITRDSGETDQELQQRIALEVRILNSRGTIREIQEVFQNDVWIDDFGIFDDSITEVVEQHDIGDDAFFKLNLDPDLTDDFFRGSFGYTDSNGNINNPGVDGYNEGVYSGTKAEVDVQIIKDTVKRLRAAGVSTRLFKVGEFGYTSNNTTVDEDDLKGFNRGRYSGHEGARF